jgi:hypothetical protein
MHAFVFFFGGSKRFDSTFVRGLSLGILCSMILGSHSLDQTAHGALQIFDMRLLPLIMNDVYKMALRRRAHRYLHKLFFFLENPFCNSVFHSKTHLCAKFRFIIMNYAMDVVIPLVFQDKSDMIAFFVKTIF